MSRKCAKSYTSRFILWHGDIVIVGFSISVKRLTRSVKGLTHTYCRWFLPNRDSCYAEYIAHRLSMTSLSFRRGREGSDRWRGVPKPTRQVIQTGLMGRTRYLENRDRRAASIIINLHQSSSIIFANGSTSSKQHLKLTAHPREAESG